MKRLTLSLRSLPAAVGAGLLLGGAGCAGTSPQLSAPQLSPPNPSRGASGGGANAASPVDEAKLPPLEAVKTPDGAFVALPYLQLGPDGGKPVGKTDTLALVWLAPDAAPKPAPRPEPSATPTPAADAKPAATPKAAKTTATPDTWAVEVRPASGGAWKKTGAVRVRRIEAAGEVAAHRVCSVALTDLAPGALFDYRVSRGGTPVFAARARARRPADAPSYRFVVFGDAGADSAGQKRIAHQASLARPDLVFITGDIVYDRGLMGEYQTNFFPIYNAEKAGDVTGAPLLRSTLFAASPGNHDLVYRDFGKWPDALAYYHYWSVPNNGPALTAGGPNTPKVSAESPAAQKFLKAAGDAYPRAASYSFDYGNAHWTVLDANYYVEWDNKALRAWVEKDLASAKNATWRFVAFHVPPFSSSDKHQEEQWMRVLCDVFEKHKVDVVWSGHVHNYQRTFPLRFAVKRGADGGYKDAKGRVDGEFKFDKAFDGELNTRPDGVVYVVTGGGGAPLYDRETEKKPDAWKPFTAKYIAAEHSFTRVDVAGTSLTVRQIGADGKELDKFTISK